MREPSSEPVDLTEWIRALARDQRDRREEAARFLETEGRRCCPDVEWHAARLGRYGAAYAATPVPDAETMQRLVGSFLSMAVAPREGADWQDWDVWTSTSEVLWRYREAISTDPRALLDMACVADAPPFAVIDLLRIMGPLCAPALDRMLELIAAEPGGGHCRAISFKDDLCAVVLAVYRARPELLESLRPHLERTDSSGWPLLMQVVAELGMDAAVFHPLIVRMASSTACREWRQFWSALARTAPEPSDMILHFRRGLADDRVGVRFACLHGARHLGSHAAELLPELERALDDNSGIGEHEASIPGYALEVVANIGPGAVSLVPAIIAFFDTHFDEARDREDDDRWDLKCIAALAAIGPGASAGVPVLCRTLVFGDWQSVPAAIRALHRIEPNREALLAFLLTGLMDHAARLDAQDAREQAGLQSAADSAEAPFGREIPTNERPNMQEVVESFGPHILEVIRAVDPGLQTVEARNLVGLCRAQASEELGDALAWFGDV